MTGVRAVQLSLMVAVAVVLQAVVFRYVAVDGVVPNLALILVVVAAFARGPEFAAVMGFGAGLLLDLAPPADHVAGRWALALVVVGYLAGRVRQDAKSSPVVAILTVAACSFVGTSVFALSGVVLHDGAAETGEMIRVIGIGVLWDLLLAALLVPTLLKTYERIIPPQIAV